MLTTGEQKSSKEARMTKIPSIFLQLVMKLLYRDRQLLGGGTHLRTHPQWPQDRFWRTNRLNPDSGWILVVVWCKMHQSPATYCFDCHPWLLPKCSKGAQTFSLSSMTSLHFILVQEPWKLDPSRWGSAGIFRPFVLTLQNSKHNKVQEILT